MPSTKGFGSGFKIAQLWRSADDGSMAGTVGESLAVNTVSGAYLLREPDSAAFEFADPTTLDIRGGDRIVAREEYGNRIMSPFDLTTPLLDTTLITLVGGTVVDTDAGEFPAFGINTQREDWPIMGIALTQRFQPKVTGSDGPRLYHTVIIPRCTLSPAYSGMTFQEGSPYTFRVMPLVTDVMDTGQTFAQSDMDFEDDRAEHYQRITRYPFSITAWRANAAATTFTLPYLPISSVVTPLTGGSPSARNVTWIDGTLTALSSANTSTGLITLAAAGTSGQHHVVYSQTEFRASA